MKAVYKSKHNLIALLKVVVLSVTFAYVIYKLKDFARGDLTVFISQFYSARHISFLVLACLILSAANWFFEILKWKILVKDVRAISFATAAKQTLAALTISLPTPARVGDYGAKILFYSRDQRKKIALLNFFGHSLQMATTSIIGSVGIVFFILRYNLVFSYAGFFGSVMSLIGVGCVAYYFRNTTILVQNFTLKNVFHFLRTSSKYSFLKVFSLSILRYVVFSIMFYMLLVFFSGPIPPYTGFILISTMYLLVSVLPSILILDVVIRGGVAIWVFSFAGISEVAVLATVGLMWIFNFVLPALVGSFFVWHFHPLKNQ